MSKFTLALVCVGALLSASASAQSYVETFTGGVNQGGWTWGNGFDAIAPSGGNPGEYLRNQNIDTFAPQPRTAPGVTSAFTGDYRARQVSSVGIDLITLATQFNFQREVTLMLGNDNGTPGVPSDDCYVYFISPFFVPQPGTGWGSFDVAVPSSSTTLPIGWAVDGPCAGGSLDAAWNNVIQNVTQVRWFYGDPTFFFIFDIWQVGMDNARIVAELGTASCFGDGSGLACPCANNGASGSGCANSTGVGAALVASGSPSLGANDATFVASSMPTTASALLFRGTQLVNGGVGVVFGDGLRCVGGTVTRLGVRTASGGTATWGPGLNLNVTPGVPTHFQVWYRNVTGPCGGRFNLTPARTITFAP